MPFIRVSYLEEHYREEQLAGIARTIMTALQEEFDVPDEDYFQVYHGHKRGEFQYSRNYLQVSRSDGLVFVQITLASGRSTEKKQRFYRELAALLQAECGIREEDVFVVLVETGLENWSFGNGVAQMIEIDERIR
ncbi:tautomerase family protein [Paenibacillus rhizovicinus]|uniref:Tautomerase family protein n=1 Tax=Paenibacillus rhizovicinus TaxID=2704463 RepID=A0A6C0P6J6_9BACL|nr:tautomerase family protein [Paenibacillus rhizovicinus]QHW34055.1 tautomerase family protein [Paenibacillus rhizovicinus]